MIFYCPQCGSTVFQGATVCPSCGAALKLVIQSNEKATNMHTSVVKPAAKYVNLNTAEYAEIVHNMQNEQSSFTLKYNENADPNNKVEQTDENADIMITGLEGLYQDERDMEKMFQESAKAVNGNAEQASAVSGNDLAKYKIITQVYDKKIGFDAADLETRLNMYAKLGYHIVPNTMICQPGQDFFVLMERNTQDTKKKQEPKAEQETEKTEDIEK